MEIIWDKIKTDEYEENQNICVLSRFVLNNNIGDATNMKEYLSYDMLNSMGIVIPGYAYANVKMNDKPWGFYLAVEAIDEDFLERNYKSLEGNLYKVESQNMQNPREYNSYEEMLRYFAVNSFLVNLDSTVGPINYTDYIYNVY